MRRVFFAAALVCFCSLPAGAQQVYRWVDEQGITHFGAQPPEGVKASGVNTKVPKLGGGAAEAAGAPAAGKATREAVLMDAQQRTLEAEVRAQVEKEEAEREKFCKDTRMNLAQLRNNPRLNYTDEEGKVQRLDEEERQRRIVEAEMGLEDVCSG